MATVSATGSIAVSVAGLHVAVSCADPIALARLAERYSAFPAEGRPALQIELSPGLYEQREPCVEVRSESVAIYDTGLSARLNLAAGRARVYAAPQMAADAADYVLRVACAFHAFEAGGLLVHGAGIAYGPRGYLLLGPSGAGKTTAARNSPGGHVLNDDLVMLMPTGERWSIHATPFSNPTQVRPAGNASATLTAIFRLVQSPRVARSPLRRAEAAAELVSLTPAVALDPQRGAALLRRAHAIAAAVPCERLELLPDPSFWAVIEPAVERNQQ